jgi:23S rRNA (cytidine2498-2'-O)-methyltransferase
LHSALLASGPRPVRNAEATSEVTGAGKSRCEWIRAALVELLREKRRHLLRQLRPQPTPFTPGDSLVQLLLTSPTTGWLSVAVAPEPFRLRHWISPFPGGEIPVAVDKAAPSRAFAKLVEAELRFGRRIAPGETCVDLGASPGGWTWVARQRGARVIAVDRSPLREDLMADPAVTFVRGDAFSYQPDRPVDWLVCDVIAAPERSIELVLDWVRRRWARHFVVTIKLREGDHPKLDRLKQELPALADDWYLTHLCANKHEACVFGSIRPEGSPVAESATA